MKIFIINLEKDKKRYENLCNQLHSNNFYNYERVDAVYGKDVYHNYKTKLRAPELGIYLSFQKTFLKILEQNLDYGIILEDDVTITEWFSRLEEIINSLPKTFDVCWIGNARAKWPRNPCNLIPDYDYDKIAKYRINDYVYKINHLSVSGSNFPMGCYGIVISKSGIIKFLSQKNHFVRPIDVYLVENINLEKYMTVPSIITHCFDFGTNIGLFENKIHKNPFENVWKNYKKQELEVLELMNNMTELFSKNNINYSLMYGTLIGYGRNKKFINYDDDIDIIININDLQKLENLIPQLKEFCNVYKFKKPIINNSLYYKLYPINNSKTIKNYEYKWPFIDIFVYEKKDNGIFSNAEKKHIETSEDFIYDYMKSHNNNNQYKVQVFKDYKKILDTLYTNWNLQCISSEWNHIDEVPIKDVYEFNCSNVIYDYNNNDNKNTPHVYKKRTNFKWWIFIYKNIIILFVILIIIYYFKNSKHLFKSSL